MYKLWIALGACFGGTAVAMAAAAAHGLSARLAPPALHAVGSAVQMQGWHALALVLCGVWMQGGNPPGLSMAALAFTLGLLGFCGAVYTQAIGGVRLPYVAPAGGMLLMLGWALLAVAALRAP